MKCQAVLLSLETFLLAHRQEHTLCSELKTALTDPGQKCFSIMAAPNSYSALSHSAHASILKCMNHRDVTEPPEAVHISAQQPGHSSQPQPNPQLALYLRTSSPRAAAQQLKFS